MERPRVGNKTGPKPQLSANDIAECALKLGVDNFTIGQIAKELGVVPSAVYRHVDGREDIVIRAFIRAGRQLQQVPMDLSWQDLLRWMADDMWRLFDRYPGLAPAVFTTPGAHVGVQKYCDDVVRALLEADFPGGRGRALFAMDMVGDSVTVSRVFHEHLTSVGEDGMTGLERAKKIFQSSAYVPANIKLAFAPEESWMTRDGLNAQLDFIIEALEVIPPRSEYSRY